MRRRQSDGIRPLGKDRWQVRVSGGRRTVDGQVTYPEVTRVVRGTWDDAMQARLFLLAEAGKAEPGMGERITVADLLRRWLDTKDDLELTTRADYERYIERDLVPELGHRPIGAVTALELETMYRRWRDKGLSARTIKLRTVPLGAAFAAAVDRWEMVGRNPVKAAKLPTDRRQRQWVIPTAAQLEALWAAAAGVHPVMAVVTYLAAGSGMRRGEMCGLQWADVDADARQVHVQRSMAELKVDGELLAKDPKTHADRLVHVPDSVVAVLATWQRVQATRAIAAGLPPGEWVASLNGHDPVWPSTVTHWWAKTRTAAKVKGVRLHDLRHAYATWALAQGMTPLDVAKQLGHASPVMILTVYGHSLTEGQRKVADIIGRALPALPELPATA